MKHSTFQGYFDEYWLMTGICIFYAVWGYYEFTAAQAKAQQCQGVKTEQIQKACRK